MVRRVLVPRIAVVRLTVPAVPRSVVVMAGPRLRRALIRAVVRTVLVLAAGLARLVRILATLSALLIVCSARLVLRVMVIVIRGTLTGARLTKPTE